LSFAETKWIKVMFAQTVMVRLTWQSVNSVITGDDEELSPGELKYTIKKKMEHLRGVERNVLMLVMNESYDLFLYDRSGMLPCTSRGIHKMKTDALTIKKNRYKVPFALKEAKGRQLDILQRGAITPPCSEWAAPMILVKEKSTILQNIVYVQIFVG